jgi:hypothetical protein
MSSNKKYVNDDPAFTPVAQKAHNRHKHPCWGKGLDTSRLDYFTIRPSFSSSAYPFCHPWEKRKKPKQKMLWFHLRNTIEGDRAKTQLFLEYASVHL